MTGFDVLFAAAGNLYLLLALAGIGVALWMGKTWVRKLTYAALVLAVFIAPIAPEIYRTVEYRSKLAKARALFEERCKTAGEKIYKTVDNVEGVLLVKIRPDKINFSEQYVMDDPYGQENSGGDGYIRSFLAGRVDAHWLTDKTTKGAYLFVEVVDPASTNITQYTAKNVNKDGRNKLLLNSDVSSPQGAKYVVDWQDESTKTDRDNWIACGSITVLDIGSKEVLGKRIGCMFDMGMGDTSGGRSPWAYARNTACPTPRKTPDGRAIFDPIDRNFVEKTLKPKTER